jgi:hypothetical protein
MSQAHAGRMSVMVELEIGQAVMRLLEEARSEEKLDRRAEPRHPFFRPVSIQTFSEPACRFSAFSREISRTGVGLLHNMPLEPGKAELTIASTRGEPLRAIVEVVWCRPCGEGWFLSGCQFVDLADR